MSNEHNDKDELAQLSAIHAASNACARYQRESGGRDVWQTPAELAASGVGDCEDLAIDSMFRVLDAWMPGVARLGCCLRFDDKNNMSRNVHMVHLVYSPGSTSDPWVLDVAVDSVCRLSERLDLTLIYELGLDGIYVDGELVGGVGNNALWASVLDRVCGPTCLR